MNQRKIGALLSYSTIALQNIVGLAYTPYLLRMLGKSEYGLYSLVTSIIAYLTLLDFGFGDTIIRYTAKYRAEQKTLQIYSFLGMFFWVYAIVAVLCVLIGGFLVFNLNSIFSNSLSSNEISRAQIMLGCLVLNLSLTFVCATFRAVLDAYEQFVFCRTLNLLRIVFNTGIMFVLLQFGFKAVALVVLMTVLNVIILISNTLYCFVKIKIRVSLKKIEWRKLKEILPYSLFVFLTAFFAHIYWFSGQLILGIYQGVKVVAVYAVAMQLVTMFRTIADSLAILFFPKITALTTQKGTEVEVSNIFIKVGRIQYLILSLIISGFIVFGKEFIVNWAGNGYEEAYVITLLFFISLLPSRTQQIGLIICKARSHLKLRTIVYSLVIVCCIIGQFWGSKYYGMLGNTISISASLVLMEGVFLNIYYQKYEAIDIVLFWKNFFKLSIIPICLTLIFLYIKTKVPFESWRSLLFGIGIYSVLFVITSYFFSLNSYEKGLLKNKL